MGMLLGLIDGGGQPRVPLSLLVVCGPCQSGCDDDCSSIRSAGADTFSPRAAAYLHLSLVRGTTRKTSEMTTSAGVQGESANGWPEAAPMRWEAKSPLQKSIGGCVATPPSSRSAARRLKSAEGLKRVCTNDGTLLRARPLAQPPEIEAPIHECGAGGWHGGKKKNIPRRSQKRTRNPQRGGTWSFPLAKQYEVGGES